MPISEQPAGAPTDISAIRKRIRQFLRTSTTEGRKIGTAKFGVYAFYDYDGEPIYVGQTKERLSGRIARHLSNQRTDAVAMNVLDPFEVAEIEVWPFFELQSKSGKDRRASRKLAAAEYAVYGKVLKRSTFKAVLNEKDVPKTNPIDLPGSYRGRIIPDELYESRKHPDVRIARRAATIANLAKVISERQVSKGLRRTLLTQARRLERLARLRFEEIEGRIPVGPED